MKARKPLIHAIIEWRIRWHIFIFICILEVLARVRRSEILLYRCVPLVSDALRRASVKRVTFAIKPCHGRCIGVASPDIQQLTILAGFVRVQ
jgi:hypothetical protein